jgi:hypothetical protein
MEPGELRGIAEVLAPRPAVATDAAGSAEPGHPDAVADLHVANRASHGFDDTNDLVAENER